MPQSWTRPPGNDVCHNHLDANRISLSNAGYLTPCPPVARIALVSQDRARQIEAILLRMAQSGQLRGRVTEEQLIDILDKVREVPSSERDPLFIALV